MKFLKWFVLFLMLLGLNNSYAQLEKGNLLIGGGVGLSLQFEDGDNVFGLSLNPSALSLVSNNIAVGGALGLSYINGDQFSSTSISFLPAGRFYFSGENENLAFYVDAQAGVQIVRASFNGNSDTETVMTYRFGPGVSYFISDEVSIDTGLLFNHVGGEFDRSSLNLTMGLQVFLRGKDEE